MTYKEIKDKIDYLLSEDAFPRKKAKRITDEIPLSLIAQIAQSEEELNSKK